MVATAHHDGKPNGGPCGGCGYLFPPGSDTCLVCGRVEPLRGDPYPVGRVFRHDWLDAQHVGNATAKAVLGALVRHDKPWSNTPGTVFPSVARLAQILECAESRVHRGLRYLKDKEWIEITHRLREGIRRRAYKKRSCRGGRWYRVGVWINGKPNSQIRSLDQTMTEETNDDLR